MARHPPWFPRGMCSPLSLWSMNATDAARVFKCHGSNRGEERS